MLICLGVKRCPCSLYTFCNRLWTGHLEPLRTSLLELIHHCDGDDICVSYMWLLKCAANRNLTLKYFERKYLLPVSYLYSDLLFNLLFPFQQRHISFPFFSSSTLILQVQTGPLKSSRLVPFQIYWRALTGPPQICFSSAEQMKRLLSFPLLLIACDE